MNLSINQMTTYRWSFDEDVARYKAHGIRAMGVWRQKLADFGEERGIDLLGEAGLNVSNLLWAGGFTGNDLRSFRESVDDSLDAIRLAASMRAGCLVVYTGARAGHTHNHARRLLRDAFAELLPAADAAQVTLAIEPMHECCAGEWTFLTSLDETLETIAAFGSPRVKLVFDTYHFGSCSNVLARLPEIAGQVAVVHLGDRRGPPDREQNRCPLGEGAIPLTDLIRSLRAGGFDGYYDVELLGPEIEASDYDTLIERSKQAFARLDSAAA